jgi:hypothetical protein
MRLLGFGLSVARCFLLGTNYNFRDVKLYLGKLRRQPRRVSVLSDAMDCQLNSDRTNGLHGAAIRPMLGATIMEAGGDTLISASSA